MRYFFLDSDSQFRYHYFCILGIIDIFGIFGILADNWV